MGKIDALNRIRFRSLSNTDIINELIERYNDCDLVEYELLPIEHLLIGFDDSTLINKMKLDHFRKILNKYTLEQIEERIPE